MKNLVCKLNEGFNLYRIDKNRFSVEMTDEHEDGLDTSLVNNPLCTELTVELTSPDKSITVPVVSIFTRRDRTDQYRYFDGNPVLYALKQENGYTFRAYKKDIRFIREQFKKIFLKYFNVFSDNATVICPSKTTISLPKIGVVVPSSNQVNDMIAALIKEVASGMKFVTNAISKLKISEVWNTAVEPTSDFYKYWLNKGYDDSEIAEALDDLNSILADMQKETGGVYKRHLIKDKDMRNALLRTMQFNKHASSYRKEINGRDILLIDDSLTYGQTVKECVNILYDAYAPKSITVLTMFSQKQR